MLTARLDLSEEAEIVMDFCRKSPAIKIQKITAGIDIFLGSTVEGDPDWILFPRMLCSPECFKEICQEGLLIHAVERLVTHHEYVYIVAREKGVTHA